MKISSYMLGVGSGLTLAFYATYMGYNSAMPKTIHPLEINGESTLIVEMPDFMSNNKTHKIIYVKQNNGAYISLDEVKRVELRSLISSQKQLRDSLEELIKNKK